MYNPTSIFHNTVPDDVINIDDPKFRTDQYDPTYAQSIFKFKRRNENKYILNEKQLLSAQGGGIQTEIKPSMRITLIDWLVRIADDYRLDSGTYSLAIHLLDQTLSLINVKRSHFQLLGCACLWLAAKLEELHPPPVESLALIADYCFEVEQLVNYEKKLLRIFEYRPAMPTRHYFVMRFVRAGECSPREISLAQYITELSFYDVTLLTYPMSAIAAASLHLTLQIMRPLNDLDNPDEPYMIWTPTLKYYTGYSEVDLVAILLNLREKHFHVEHAEHKYIQRKYEKPSFHRVTQIGPLRLEDVRFDSDIASSVMNELLNPKSEINVFGDAYKLESMNTKSTAPNEESNNVNRDQDIKINTANTSNNPTRNNKRRRK